MNNSAEIFQYNVAVQSSAMNLWQSAFHLTFQQTGKVSQAIADAESARKAFLAAFPVA